MISVCVMQGRLAQNPEARTTTDGTKIATFTLVVGKSYKPKNGAPDADFFRLKAFKSTADFCESYLTKGRLVAVQCRPCSNRYTAQDGSTREAVEFVIESISPCDRPREDKTTTVQQNEEYDPFADGAE